MAQIDEDDISAEVVEGLHTMCSESPPDLRGCERELKRVPCAAARDFHVPRPPPGKVVMYEAEMGDDGSWKYSRFRQMVSNQRPTYYLATPPTYYLLLSHTAYLLLTT